MKKTPKQIFDERRAAGIPIGGPVLKEWNVYHRSGEHAHKLAGIVWAKTQREAEEKVCDRWHMPDGVYARERDE